jgi:O-antigen/teichoic acid export membrane protein
VYYLVSIQLVEIYSITMLESCIQAKMPQALGYGLVVQQTCRVVLGYLFIVYLNMLLLGAVITTISAFALQIFYYLKLFAAELRQKVRWEYVGEWFKGSLANVYFVCGNQVAAYVFILLFNFGGEGARGRYGAAAIVANVITYSAFLAYALYPKLLSEGSQQEVAAALRLVLMFAVPMTVGAIVMSDSYMTLFSAGEQAYTDSGPVLIVLALDAFVMVISSFLSWLLFGLERVDEKAKISLRQLAGSRLLVYFSLPYLHSLIAIPATLYFLTYQTPNQPMQSALYVSIINASVRLLMTFILFAVVRKMTRIEIPWRSAAKYFLAAVIMGLGLILIPYTAQRFLILAKTAVGGVIYMSMLLVIDKQARNLISGAMAEVKHKVKRT